MFIIARVTTSSFIAEFHVLDAQPIEEKFNLGQLHVTPDQKVGQGTWQPARIGHSKGSDDIFNFPASQLAIGLEIYTTEQLRPELRAYGSCSWAYDCLPEGGHEYAEKVCRNCGKTFCYACCGATNVHLGGKHSEDFMTCPACGYDWYTDWK